MQNTYKILIGLTLAVATTCLWAGGPAARVGDTTATGGAIVTGEPTVLIGGLPAARITDTTTSPLVLPGIPPIPCVGGPILTGSPTVLIGGLPAAHLGSLISLECGFPDFVVQGDPTVLIN
jgi:uncharacterized Zn-binding protein involved in type VI secretion